MPGASLSPAGCRCNGVTATDSRVDTTNHRLALAAALCVTVFVTIVMWGPVARGLHEQSVARWCTWSATGSQTTSLDLEPAVAQCVERALADPAYLTALRASL